MEKKTRVAAIIIQDGKLLMLKGKNYDELWTPGGKIAEGETDEECLRRELQEEIHVELESMESFGEYTHPSPYQKDVLMTNKVYLVRIQGVPRPDHEIETCIWLTYNDFVTQRYPILQITKKQIIPDLIKKGIWKP